MDDDDERRHQPSLHRAFGEATALLASYALISAEYGYLAQNGLRLGVQGGEISLFALENVAHNTGLEGATGGNGLIVSSRIERRNIASDHASQDRVFV